MLFLSSTFLLFKFSLICLFEQYEATNDKRIFWIRIYMLIVIKSYNHTFINYAEDIYEI